MADIDGGVAGDGDHIGEFAGGEGAEAVGDAEEFGVDAGGGFEGVERLHAVVDEEAELAGVAAVGVDAGVGAEGDFDPGGDGAADGEVDGIEGEAAFADDAGVKTPAGDAFADAFCGHEGGDVVGAFGDHQLQGFVVEERAVFDRVNAGADGAFGTFGAVGVSGGFLTHAVGLVDQGVHFFLRELGGVDVVVKGHNAAGGANLDDVGTVLDVPADSGAHGVSTVANGGVFEGVGEGSGDITVGGVAVAAGGADGVDDGEHAGAFDVAFVDGFAEADVHELGAAEIADGGEAGVKGDLGIGDGG